METYSDSTGLQVLIEVLGFVGLALLGWLLVQLIYWDSVLQDRRDTWLRQLQLGRRQLRTLRRSLEQAQNLPGLQLPPSLRKKWRMIRWITTALSAAKWARS